MKNRWKINIYFEIVNICSHKRCRGLPLSLLYCKNTRIIHFFKKNAYLYVFLIESLRIKFDALS